MIVSDQCVRGGLSRLRVSAACQRGPVSSATHFGTKGAESRSSDGEVIVGRSQLITEVSIVPADLALEGAGVGVDEQLVAG